MVGLSGIVGISIELWEKNRYVVALLVNITEVHNARSIMEIILQKRVDD